jgi:hypothetical protein
MVRKTLSIILEIMKGTFYFDPLRPTYLEFGPGYLEYDTNTALSFWALWVSLFTMFTTEVLSKLYGIIGRWFHVVSKVMGIPPIAGWFIMENPSING